MSVEVRVLCRPGIASGFALAGLPIVEAPTEAAAIDRLRELLARPEIGVILMEESAHRGLPDDLRRLIARRPLPMVVPFPGPEWQAEKAVDSYIVELLRQVIGYRVRLR